MDNTLEPPDNSTGSSSGMGSHQRHFSSYSFKGRNELFYENYDASEYASTSTPTYGSVWHQQSGGNSLSGCCYSANYSATRHHGLRCDYEFGGVLDSPVLSKHVGLTSRTPPSPPASQPTLTRDLPPADPDTDYMDHGAVYSRYFSSEGSLSPLYQEWQNNRISLSSLPQDMELSLGFPGELEAKEHMCVASIHSDYEETSPERRAYPSLLDIPNAFETWTMSPESVETDLDDESILSSSTSSLSPSYQELSELGHSYEDDEGDEEDQEDRYFSHASPSSSPPMPDRHQRYHPLEEYPSHFHHLYNKSQSHSPPLSSHPKEGLHQDDDNDGVLQPPSPLHLSSSSFLPLEFDGQHGYEPLPSLQFSPSPLLELQEGSGLGLSLPSPSSARLPQFLSPFPSSYDFGDDPTTIPGSPSRRRSTDLPSLDDDPYPDPFGLQGPGASSTLDPRASTSTSASEPTAETQRMHFLTLPGGETDDDLIPRELASKNYVPDPTITVPTASLLSSSSNGRSLLIWDPDGSSLGLDAKDGVGYHYPPPRSPSPDNVDLDAATLAELAPEARRVYELKQRTTKGQSWERERERSRELSALLRLKLGLDEKPAVGGSSNLGGADGKMTAKADDEGDQLSQASSGESASATTIRSASLPTPSSTSMALAASTSNGSSSSQQHQARKSSKPKITSMAQLVANMVFHRQQQQDTFKRTPTRSRSWAAPSYSPSSSSGPAISSPLTGAKGHATPKSPLRQVTLPAHDDEDEDDEDRKKARDGETESPLPLSPLFLCTSPLSFSTDLAPVAED